MRARNAVAVVILSAITAATVAGEAFAGSVPSAAPPPGVWTPTATVVPAAAADPAQVAHALDAADFVLSLQNRRGAILDHPGAGIANTDSHLQYALMGLAAAYRTTGQARYLTAMRDALAWLGGRQRPDGSWWIAYSAAPPYRPVRSVRGVSATAALYIYDLWLYRELSGDTAWVAKRLPRVRRALSFLSTMRAPDGTYYSAWVRTGGRYVRDSYRFTSDQADVHLGLRAAARLLRDRRYGAMAHTLRTALTGPRFYLGDRGRYARGLLPSGQRDTRMDVLTVWPQGYVPWVLGSTRRTRGAVSWLRGRVRPDGSVRAWRRDPVYSLSAEVLVMGSIGVDGAWSDHPTVASAGAWLARVARLPSGGLRDNLRRATAFCNVAGFATISWLRVPALVP